MSTIKDPWEMLEEARKIIALACDRDPRFDNGLVDRIDAALLKELQDSATDDVTTEVEWIRAGLNSFLTTTDDTACVVELSKERWNWDARIYGDCATEAEAKEAALKAARARKGDKR
jgi:hypothetical protein